MSTVGIIVNPVAGKDIRRLVAAASHTSDIAKVGIVRRVIEGALDAGAQRVVVAPDTNGIGARAVDGLDRATLLDGDLTGSRHDTVGAARALRDEGTDVLVVLGGDGTCRDVALGWPDAPLIAISTGTNNVYPMVVDGTSAGWAAGLVATGRVAVDVVAAPTKRVAVQITDRSETPDDDTALVELALIDATSVGSRAVLDPASVRTIIAAVARPASTGLSSVAGRLMPLDDEADGGIVVELGTGQRTINVPLTPGSSDRIEVAGVRRIDGGEPTTFHGPGVLAFDGERDRVLSEDAVVVAWIERTGPRRIDVDRTLTIAAAGQLFDGDPAPTRRDT